MEEFLSTKEISKLLNINEKKIYILAQQGKIPATMVTGKWLFPKNLVTKFIEGSANENLATNNKVNLNKTILGAGSDDISIDIIENSFSSYDKEHNFFYSRIGSFNGLKLLKQNICDFSFSHIYDKINKRYNFSFLNTQFDIDNIVVINLLYRNIGFVYKGNLDIDNFKKIATSKLSFINRQIGSGIRNFVEDLIDIDGINRDEIKGYNDCVKTHNEVGLKICFTDKDVGISTEYIADLYKLNFTFLIKERFDLVIYKDRYFEKKNQKFIEFIKNSSFLKEISHLKGYDTTDSGKILFKDFD